MEGFSKLGDNNQDEVKKKEVILSTIKNNLEINKYNWKGEWILINLFLKLFVYE